VVIEDGKVKEMYEKGHHVLREAVENYKGGFPVKKYSQFIEEAIEEEVENLPKDAKIIPRWQKGEDLIGGASAWSLALNVGEDYSELEKSRLKELGLEYPFTEDELKKAWENAPETLKSLNPYKKEENKE